MINLFSIFPVADFREVKMKILQFGADVKVLEPEELAKEVREEIGRMKKVYGVKRKAHGA